MSREACEVDDVACLRGGVGSRKYEGPAIVGVQWGGLVTRFQYAFHP
jgi:hypothetical protein